MATNFCWVSWCDNTSTSTSTTTWDVWCYTGTAPVSTTGKLWVTWCSTSATTCVTATDNYITYKPRPETEAEKAERLARQARYQREEEERRQRQAAATKRAEELLWSHLTDEQRSEHRRSKSFVVRGCHTKNRYRVHCGAGLAANVHELDDEGRTRRRLCAHISHSIGAPNPDHYLAQKLMLEHQEPEFLRVANDHGR